MYIWSRNLLLQSSNIQPVPENFIKYSNGNIIIYKDSETNKIYDQILNLLDPQPAYDDIYSSYILNNASIVGTLTSPRLGKYTGFSTSNYIKPYMSLAQNCGSNPWKVQIKFNLNTINKTNFLWGGNAGTYLPDIYVTWENTFKIRLSSNGSSYDITDGINGTFTVQANTDYWVRLEYTGSKYSLSYSTDGETFTEDISVTSSTHIENTSDISVIGVRGDLGDPIDGYIDLSDSYYELNGTKYNFGYKQLNQGIIIKEPSFTLQNATVNGTLTNNNGVYSGFGTSNCLTSNVQIDLSKDFEFYIQVTVPNVNTIGTSMDAYQIIVGKDLYFQLCFRGFADKCIQKLGSNSGNGSSWQQGKDSGSLTYIPNQTYDIKVVKEDGTIYVYSKSVYNTEYILDFSYSCTQTSSLYPNLGSYNNGGSQYLKTGGKINMAATKLVQNGTTTTFNSAASITIPQGMYEGKGTAEDHYTFDEEGNLVDCDNEIYIESTGTQYINTGIVPSSTTRVKIIEAQTVSATTSRSGWGSTGGQEAFWWGQLSSKQNLVSSVSTSWVNTDLANFTVGTPYTLDLKSGEQSMNGTVYGTTTIGDTATSGQTLYLSALHTEYDSGIQYSKNRTYRCQIWNGNTLVRDYIPVKAGMKIKNYVVPSNGMWEAVNQTFKGNDGTGNFYFTGDELTKLKVVYSTKAASDYNSAWGSGFSIPAITPASNKALKMYFRITGNNNYNGRPSEITLWDSTSTISVGFNCLSMGSTPGSIFIYDGASSSAIDSSYAFNSPVQWIYVLADSSYFKVYGSTSSTYNYETISSWTQIASWYWTRLTEGKNVRFVTNTTNNTQFSQVIIKHDNDVVFDLQTSDLSNCILGAETVIGEILV